MIVLNVTLQIHFFDNTLNISNLDLLSTSSTGNEPDIFYLLSNLCKQHPKRLICASLNINSLRNKFYSIQKLLLNNIFGNQNR